jgi:hypothetical protein
VLYFVPVGKHGKPRNTFKTLPVTGPAAQLNGQFNLNGIRAVDHDTYDIVLVRD